MNITNIQIFVNRICMSIKITIFAARKIGFRVHKNHLQ